MRVNLSFGDDIVVYIVAETKLYAQQSGEVKARKRHCVQCKKDGKKIAGGRAKETVHALCKYPCFLLYHSELY